MVLEVLAYKAKKQVSPPQAATGATASNIYFDSACSRFPCVGMSLC